MIAAIDPGVGLKEDKPTMPVERPGNPAFDKAFRSATTYHPSSFRAKPDSESRPSAARAHERFGTMHGSKRGDEAQASRADQPGKPEKPEEKKEEEPAARNSSAPGERAGRPEEADTRIANPYAQQSKVEPAPAGTDKGVPEQLAGLLVPAEGKGAQALVAANRPPIDAQIGLTAYLMGPHGKTETVPGSLTEGQADPQATVVSSTALAQAALEAGVGPKVAPSAARELALQQAPPLEGHEPLQSLALQAKEVLKLSKEADPGDRSDKKAAESGVELDKAQARNELLSGIGTTTGTAAQARVLFAPPLHSALQGGAHDKGESGKEGATLLGQARHADAGQPTLAAAAPPAAAQSHAALAQKGSEEALGRGVVDQVVQGARWLISNHRNEMTVKLHPEHLGELNLKVVHKDGLFRVDMTVDSLAAKHLLESNLTQLREHLHAENPAAGEFLFNVDVRKGNDSRPEAYARMSRDVGAARPVDALEPAEEAVRRGLGRGAWGNHSLSIYA